MKCSLFFYLDLGTFACVDESRAKSKEYERNRN